MPQTIVIDTSKIRNHQASKKVRVTRQHDKFVDLTQVDDIHLADLLINNRLDILQNSLDNLAFRDLDMRTLSPHTRLEVVKLFQLSQMGIKELLKTQEELLVDIDHSTQKHDDLKRQVHKKKKVCIELDHSCKHTDKLLLQRKKQIGILESLVKASRAKQAQRNAELEMMSKIQQNTMIRFYMTGIHNNEEYKGIEFYEKLDIELKAILPIFIRKTVFSMTQSDLHVSSMESQLQVMKITHQNQVIYDATDNHRILLDSTITLRQAHIKDGDTLFVTLSNSISPQKVTEKGRVTSESPDMYKLIDMLVTKQQETMKEVTNEMRQGWESALKNLSALRSQQEETSRQLTSQAMEREEREEKARRDLLSITVTDRMTRLEEAMRDQLNSQLREYENKLHEAMNLYGGKKHIYAGELESDGLGPLLSSYDIMNLLKLSHARIEKLEIEMDDVIKTLGKFSTHVDHRFGLVEDAQKKLYEDVLDALRNLKFPPPSSSTVQIINNTMPQIEEPPITPGIIKRKAAPVASIAAPTPRVVTHIPPVIDEVSKTIDIIVPPNHEFMKLKQTNTNKRNKSALMNSHDSDNNTGISSPSQDDHEATSTVVQEPSATPEYNAVTIAVDLLLSGDDLVHELRKGIASQLNLPLAQVLLTIDNEIVRLGYDVDNLLSTTHSTLLDTISSDMKTSTFNFTPHVAHTWVTNTILSYVIEKETPITDAQLDFLVEKLLKTSLDSDIQDHDPLQDSMMSPIADSKSPMRKKLTHDNKHDDSSLYSSYSRDISVDSEAKGGDRRAGNKFNFSWDSILSSQQTPEYKRNTSNSPTTLKNLEDKHYLDTTINSMMSRTFMSSDGAYLSRTLSRTMSSEQNHKYYAEVENSLLSQNARSPTSHSVLDRSSLQSETTRTQSVEILPTMDKLKNAFIEASFRKSMSSDELNEKMEELRKSTSSLPETMSNYVGTYRDSMAEALGVISNETWHDTSRMLRSTMSLNSSGGIYNRNTNSPPDSPPSSSGMNSPLRDSQTSESLLKTIVSIRKNIPKGDVSLSKPSNTTSNNNSSTSNMSRMNMNSLQKSTSFVIDQRGHEAESLDTPLIGSIDDFKSTLMKKKQQQPNRDTNTSPNKPDKPATLKRTDSNGSNSGGAGISSIPKPSKITTNTVKKTKSYSRDDMNTHYDDDDDNYDDADNVYMDRDDSAPHFSLKKLDSENHVVVSDDDMITSQHTAHTAINNKYNTTTNESKHRDSFEEKKTNDDNTQGSNITNLNPAKASSKIDKKSVSESDSSNNKNTKSHIQVSVENFDSTSQINTTLSPSGGNDLKALRARLLASATNTGTGNTASNYNNDNTGKNQGKQKAQSSGWSEGKSRDYISDDENDSSSHSTTKKSMTQNDDTTHNTGQGGNKNKYISKPLVASFNIEEEGEGVGYKKSVPIKQQPYQIKREVVSIMNSATMNDDDDDRDERDKRDKGEYRVKQQNSQQEEDDEDEVNDHMKYTKVKDTNNSSKTTTTGSSIQKDKAMLLKSSTYDYDDVQDFSPPSSPLGPTSPSKNKFHVMHIDHETVSQVRVGGDTTTTTTTTNTTTTGGGVGGSRVPSRVPSAVPTPVVRSGNNTPKEDLVTTTQIIEHQMTYMNELEKRLTSRNKKYSFDEYDDDDDDDRGYIGNTGKSFKMDTNKNKGTAPLNNTTNTSTSSMNNISGIPRDMSHDDVEPFSFDDSQEDSRDSFPQPVKKVNNVKPLRETPQTTKSRLDTPMTVSTTTAGQTQRTYSTHMTTPLTDLPSYEIPLDETGDSEMSISYSQYDALDFSQSL